LGIRPEHIQVAASPQTPHLMVDVVVVEPLGREILVRAIAPDLDSDSSLIQFQIPPGMQIRVGDRLPLHVDLAQLVAFDPASGDALSLS
jgi:multiple sugar transport system ATP-binding protein